jgi:N-methylhydantoinase B
VAYGVAGLENSGHGMFGGYPGAPSVMVLMEKTKVNELLASNKPPTQIASLSGQQKILPYCNFEINQGDVLYMRVASGGGYGDPLERDPELVRNDVANSIVSLEAAREIYGVVIQKDGLQVDVEATRQLRTKIRQQELEGGR